MAEERLRSPVGAAYFQEAGGLAPTVVQTAAVTVLGLIVEADEVCAYRAGRRAGHRPARASAAGLDPSRAGNGRGGGRVGRLVPHERGMSGADGSAARCAYLPIAQQHLHTQLRPGLEDAGLRPTLRLGVSL